MTRFRRIKMKKDKWTSAMRRAADRMRGGDPKALRRKRRRHPGANRATRHWTRRLRAKT